MQPVYDQYFRNQLLQARQLSLSEPAGPRPFLDPNVISLIPQDWRSDAQIFLLNNIIGMVVAPYVSANPSPPLLQSALWPLLHDDVATIVDRARRIARDRDRDYVSATSVVMALGQLAPDLKTTALQIWGPRTAPGSPVPKP